MNRKLVYIKETDQGKHTFDLKKAFSYHRGALKVFLQPLINFFKNKEWWNTIKSQDIPAQNAIICNEIQKEEYKKIAKDIASKQIKQDANRFAYINKFVYAQRMYRDYDLAMRSRKQRIMEALNQTIGKAMINKQVDGGLL